MKHIAEALKNDDFAKLQSVFLHSVVVKMLPAGASGYDHCDRLWLLLDLLACDDFDNVYRVLPEGLPLSANGYPMYIHGTNRLLCLLYNSGNAAVYPADKIMDKAEKFTQIIYPGYKNFSKDYMAWLLKQIAITCIHQPYLNSDNPYLSAKDKKAYYMDNDKMLAEFIQ